MLRNLGIELRDGGKLVVRDIGDPMELWLALRRFYQEQRPTAFPMAKDSSKSWTYPVTTNGDVRQIADIWSQVYRRVWRSGLATSTSWSNWWTEARSRIESLTAGADPSLVFVENERFWLHWTKRHAQHMAVIADAPKTRYELASEAIASAVKVIPQLPGKALGFAADTAADAATAATRLAVGPLESLLGGLFGGLGSLKKPLLYTAIGAGVLAGGYYVVLPAVRGRRALAAMHRGGAS